MSAGATKNWPSARSLEAPTPLTSTASTIVSRFVIEGCSPKREIDLQPSLQASTTQRFISTCRRRLYVT